MVWEDEEGNQEEPEDTNLPSSSIQEFDPEQEAAETKGKGTKRAGGRGKALPTKKPKAEPGKGGNEKYPILSKDIKVFFQLGRGPTSTSLLIVHCENGIQQGPTEKHGDIDVSSKKTVRPLVTPLQRPTKSVTTAACNSELCQPIWEKYIWDMLSDVDTAIGAATGEQIG